MRRLLVIAAVFAASAALASQAAAGTTTVTVSMSFTEPVVHDIRSGCPVLAEGLCGTGVVVPFGHATEMIVFGGACGGSCDFRTVNVAGGSIYLDEFELGGTCRGSCQPNPAEPGTGMGADVVVGGTGMFAGATGNLSMAVTLAGPANAVKITGTITLQS
jgi:hypothetical protein